MGDKIPLTRAGTITEGKIYLRAKMDCKQDQRVTIGYKELSLIVAPMQDVNKDDYSWFAVIRAWKYNDNQEARNV